MIIFAETNFLTSTVAFAIVTSTSSTHAGECVLGFRYDNVLDQTGTEAAAFVVEYHADPFFSGEKASFSLAVTGQFDTDKDVFVGVGGHANWVIGSGVWFVEASFMPS